LPKRIVEFPDNFFQAYYFEQGSVWAYSLSEHSAPEKDIMKRFATGFSLTFRRYQDLQKAEAQAREAQIEAALERVRSRTMAMQKSGELIDAASLLFKQIADLGTKQWSSGFDIWNANEISAVAWMSNPDGSIGKPFTVPYTEDTFFIQIYEAKQSGNDFFVMESGGKELEETYQYLFNLPDARKHFDGVESLGFQMPKFQITHCAFFAQGFLMFITYEPVPEMWDVFKRFAKVFEQTYTRFLDLQKAEVQAREAKIEAALEKVRGRTMAMQRSQEIADILGKIFVELKLLDVVLNRILIWIFNNEEKYISWWSANFEVESTAASYRVDYNEHPVFLTYLEAWQKRIPLYLYTLSGAIKDSWEDHLFRNTGLSKLPKMVQKGMRAEGTIFTTSAIGDFGLLMAGSLEPLSHENIDIIQRFSRVFQQSYTRYLDVQQAEAQAREAKIEAAMEKVRARAMAMQKPGELVEVAQLLRKEMGLLGVEELETSSIYIHDEVSGTTECWYAIQDIREQNRKLVTDYMTINLNDTWVGREMLKFYTSDQKQTSILMQGENRKEWINYCAQHSKVLQGYYGDVIPERTYHLLKFSNGYMGAASTGDISAESWELLKRATSVFSLAYTRFSDLQLAEANAKEAIKQSALDRIRADIASMRTIADLDKITPLIWNELTILGVPFIRCGVFIMDESQKLIHSFLSTPEGKAIAAFHIPYDSPGNIGQVLSHWRNKKNYIDHWDEKAFTEFANTLVKQGALKSPQQYLKTIPKGGFHLHFLPFLQGMLYVGNTTRLPEDEIKLIQSVADAFSTAYARYEDFNKLEAAKQQVDKTLVDLKQAQTQLIQSEKMASLGELTAGIAHEIQNPLNFVNNFSDVSNELLDEMKAELAKGNAEDAMAIVEDVKQNLEKILHHGKRADAIVKGMLQHSRMSSGQKELTDINALADEYLRLAYHGLRAKDKSFNAKFETDFDKRIGKINIIPQDIGRVLVNLMTNAFYAVSEKAKLSANSYEPTVIVTTKKISDKVEIKVRDNGTGIPQKILDKIFQPFFTTKPTGQGTGLGLSLAYDIITKGHGGEIKVKTVENEGTEFTIILSI
jgi:signal transduction histidine kinase